MASNATKAGWQKNRRGKMMVIKYIKYNKNRKATEFQ
jgi:hypothetical protein